MGVKLSVWDTEAFQSESVELIEPSELIGTVTIGSEERTARAALGKDWALTILGVPIEDAKNVHVAGDDDAVPPPAAEETVKLVG